MLCKLPVLKDIPRLTNYAIPNNIESIISESEELKDATIEIGKELFGDALKIE